ncbi:hydroxymethylglutaryl-CoA lyase [Thalassococcus sp. S3]|uniref:hydroxymethylglutaryl-CoA lyase n=1 Tax=Thalassococcus sp. S3 TaxID=2017482 RepID=UPI0010247459|nr:hydroxymethylglutaryl-CoA lyase [Thalassococcus sp. S3]QBF33957.1 hydroxymethylglutaryl-CoA lyase [Thalassococcus sp. S3]
MARIDITVSEVGPRDGLQSIDRVVDLETKKAWIAAEAAAGVPEIEVGSFVNYKLLPQMADTAELVAFACGIDGLTIAALVPNARGAEAALAAGAHKISIPVSASETHSLKNVRRTHAQMIEEVRAIRALVDAKPEGERPYFEAGIATAFGCTIEGHVPLDTVTRLAEELIAAGAEEVGLSDTTGYANPRMIRDRIRAVHRTVGADKLTGVHLHNTRGLGLANAAAALEEGITTLDSSLGGLGGCPFAPGASGNIVTEDLVFMLEAMGLKTGIDLDHLMQVRELLMAGIPDEPIYGFLPDAGLPLGWSDERPDAA